VSQFDSRFGGTVDFSNLGKPAPAPKEPLAPAAISEAGLIKVPSLIADLDATNIEGFLALSEHIPVLVDVYTTRSDASTKLSQKLSTEVLSRNGDVILLRLNGDAAAADLLKAFQVQHLPSVTAVLKGQAIALFAGDQTEDSIKQVVDRMISVAKDNNVVGKAEVDGDFEPQPTLPPQHLEALELIDAGNYEAAISKYQSILADSPADVLAVAGLAQVQLLNRTKGLDLAITTAQAVSDAQSAMQKADSLAVIGHFEASFNAILDRFEIADKAERETLKQHLLELFKVVPSEEPALGKARIRLANLLF
jgi:putative thioredoxin